MRRSWKTEGRVISILLLRATSIVFALPPEIRIGAILDAQETEEELAFKSAVEYINSDKHLLPGSRLVALVEKIKGDDSFRAAKLVCSLLEKGVAAIFGPTYPSTSVLVQTTCKVLQVPHLDLNWSVRSTKTNYTINLFPHPAVLSKALADLVVSQNWKTFTVIYEENEALIRLQELLKIQNVKEVKISLRQMQPGMIYKKMLKDVGKTGETNIILDVPANKISDVFKEAQSVGMMTEYHNYLVTSLDLHTVDLSDFQMGRTNISGFRLVKKDFAFFPNRTRNYISGEPQYIHQRQYGQKRTVKTSIAVIVDAVNLFANAMNQMGRNQHIQLKPLACDQIQPWPYGLPLVSYMKTLEIPGLTGTIKLDTEGWRMNFSLDHVELKKEGLTKVGTWTPVSGIKFTRNYTTVYQEVIEFMRNRTLKVTTILNAPYVMLKENADKYTGNEKFHGFCVELMQEVAQFLGFNYEFRLVRDSAYGSKNSKGEWNGMIRELIDREADLAIADLTITYVREEAVDFTMPFMNLGISILFRKPKKNEPKLFSFLAPLSPEVWLYMATAYLGVSILLFVVARFTPYEWVNPHPCEPNPSELENQFSLLNSFWFTVGSLMQQGCDMCPRAMSTRVLSGTWGFFTLIMISSYTANLAAFLTSERMKSPIESAEDLAKQSKIQYGCVASGSTKAFFKDSKIPTYKRMWSVMESAQPSVFVESNAKGIERVLKGDEQYAFLMESTTIEYITERKCELTQIGGLLDSKGYGIATPSGSPYRTPLSTAILKLQENSRLHLLKEKWWRTKGGGACIEERVKKVHTLASELGLANVGGVFVVLLAGLGMGCVIAVCEFIWKSKTSTREDRVGSIELSKRYDYSSYFKGHTQEANFIEDSTEQLRNS